MTSVKISTIKRAKSKSDSFEMVGYAADETTRNFRAGGGKQSIMMTLGIIEDETYGICKRYDLLSPLYELGIRRDGCFFCPNAAKAERLMLHERYPDLVRLIYGIIENSAIETAGYPNNWCEDYFQTKGTVGAKRRWVQQTRMLI